MTFRDFCCELQNPLARLVFLKLRWQIERFKSVDTEGLVVENLSTGFPGL